MAAHYSSSPSKRFEDVLAQPVTRPFQFPFEANEGIENVLSRTVRSEGRDGNSKRDVLPAPFDGRLNVIEWTWRVGGTYSKSGVELTIRGCMSMADSEPDTISPRAVLFVPPVRSALTGLCSHRRCWRLSN